MKKFLLLILFSTIFLNANGTGLVWEGKWSHHTEFEGRTLSIHTPSNLSQKFLFSILASNGAHVGELEGEAKIIGHSAVAMIKDIDLKPCRVEFKRDVKSIEVTTDGCFEYAGLNVSFDGIYYSGVNDFIVDVNNLNDFGIFKSDNEKKDFKELVGESYKLFEQSFQIIYNKDDLDKLNAKVSSGGVRGLFGYMEGIIMYFPDGTITAAVINDNTVEYFSSNPKFIDKLPKTIEKWRVRFKDNDVVYKTAGIFKKEKLPKSWRYPTKSELSDESREYSKKQEVRYTEVEADFNGDGIKDKAFVVISTKKKNEGLIVKLSNKDKYDWLFLSQSSFEYNPTKGISLAEPQSLKTACGSGYIECENSKLKSITLEYPSFYYDELEKGSSVYYYSKREKKFLNQALSD